MTTFRKEPTRLAVFPSTASLILFNPLHPLETTPN